MKKPVDYELKKWINERYVSGLRLYYYQTDTESSDTDWELTDTEGKTKRIKSHRVFQLVEIRPDWIRLLRLRDEFQKEIETYDKFCNDNKKDLATYERLKKKLGK